VKMLKKRTNGYEKLKKNGRYSKCANLDMSRALLRVDEAEAGAELLAEELLEGVSLVLELFSSTSQPSPRFNLLFVFFM